MDKRYKPTIIKLGRISQDNGKLLSDIARNLLDLQDDNFSTQISAKPKEKKLSLSSEASATDAELLNDFSWLINFNLKSISMYDIDEEFHKENRIHKKCRRFRKKESSLDKRDENTFKVGSLKKGPKQMRRNVSKASNPLLFTDIIEKCLWETSGITLKTLYKWIGERYPCFKQTGRKWKKCVRYCLTTNSLFKKKSIRGRSELWYLDKNSTGNKRNCSQTHEQSSSATTMDTGRQRAFHLDINDYVNSTSYLPRKGYNTPSILITDSIPTSSTEIYSQNWRVTTGFPVKEQIDIKFEEPSKYYDMQIPLAAEYLIEAGKYRESLEVNSILDDTSSISLELM